MLADCWAVVPAKPLSRAKTRLAGVLSPGEREALSRAMLRDVLAALANCPALAGTVVISADEQIARIAAEGGAVVEREADAAGLGAAVRQGMRAAAARGAAGGLYVPTDVPLVDAAVIARVLAGAASGGAIVRALRDDGTNALLCAAADPIEFRFGPGSCTRHRRSAAAAGRGLALLQESALALDLDVPEDLQRASRMPLHGATRDWFAEHASRLGGPSRRECPDLASSLG